MCSIINLTIKTINKFNEKFEKQISRNNSSQREIIRFICEKKNIHDINNLLYVSYI